MPPAWFSTLPSLLSTRIQLAVSTWPTRQGWMDTLVITGISTGVSGGIAVATGFVDVQRDFVTPNPLKMATAFIVPSLLEEVIWRGLLLPHPKMTAAQIPPSWAISVLALHVLMHPVIGESGVWPRGRDTFLDARFLALATVCLGGATCAYMATGGSVYAATVAHAIPVILWRDVFSGEARLSGGCGGIEDGGATTTTSHYPYQAVEEEKSNKQDS